METGLDILFREGLDQLKGRRLALLTNHTGVDRHLRSGVDLLRAGGGLRLLKLFSPEHGLWGAAQAGVHLPTITDARTGLPVHSLYGTMRSPTPEMLSDVDLLIYDIQDVGVRYATYISTLALAQEVAALAGIDFLVLDRPNPLNGSRVEGGVLLPEYASFVGIHPLAVRHGMTVAELARMFAAERGLPDPLVMPLRGWSRSQWFDDTRLPWVAPSPNLPTLTALTLYPGTCLIEGTNVSEGRGTTHPFEMVGAPWIDPFALAEALAARGLPGLAFRPCYFVPTFSKYEGTTCGGVQAHILDRDACRPVALGLALLEICKSVYADQFTWHVTAAGQYFVDLLSGSDGLRNSLDEGTALGDLLVAWEQEAQAFARRREPYLMYS